MRPEEEVVEVLLALTLVLTFCCCFSRALRGLAPFFGCLPFLTALAGLLCSRDRLPRDVVVEVREASEDEDAGA